MKKKKYPDQIVYDEETGKFNANVLPYGTNVGAPAIRVEDTSVWKRQGLNKVNHQLKTKFEELKEEYQKLVEEYRWNELVYNAKFNFEPVIGETYHLYVGNDGELFLSLIEPQHWKKMKCVGSFKLNSDRKWIMITK